MRAVPIILTELSTCSIAKYPLYLNVELKLDCIFACIYDKNDNYIRTR